MPSNNKNRIIDFCCYLMHSINKADMLKVYQRYYNSKTMKINYLQLVHIVYVRHLFHF
jgi:hypothetical protein